MGVQSTVFYVIITWLPTIEGSLGIDASVAGWHLFLFQIVGIVSGIGVTSFMRRRTDHRAVGIAVSTMMIVVMTGLLLAPGFIVVWIVVAGLSAGSSIVVVLSLISLRTRTTGQAGQLSGMAQGVGYLVAAVGPAAAGALHKATGSWTGPIVGIVALATVQLLSAALAG